MTVNRTLKPSPSNELNFNLPEIQELTLSNGLKVLFVTRHNLPIIRFNLLSLSGSRLDPEGKKGLANLFSMMIDEGAGDYDALQLNEEFHILGSDFDSSCSHDHTYLGMRTLKENYERSLELFSAVILKPHFKEEAYLREMRKVLVRILQIKDDPEDIANILFEHYVYERSDPYSYPSIGLERDIYKIHLADIKDFYKKYMLPDNSYLIVVGNIEGNELREKLEHYLAGWKSGSINYTDYKAAQQRERVVYVAQKEDSVQTEIRIGHITPKRDQETYFRKLLLNNILGGQFSSRINLNLRENKGYTYGAFSGFNYYKDAGYFFVSTSVSVENTAGAVKEILYELNHIRDGVTPEELEFAKTSLIRKFPSMFETNRQIASNLTRMIVHKLPKDHYNTYIPRINQININEINETAVNSIFPDEAIILLAGNQEKIMQQISGMDLGEIVISHEI